MRTRTAAFAAIVFASLPATSIADGGCAGCFWQCDVGADVQLTFAQRFTGAYRPGEPYDVVTIDPAGTGETLEDVGVSLRVRLFCDCFGTETGPVAGLPASEIVLFNSSLATGTYMPASVPTDSEGWTEFHGTMRGGGCVQSLTLFVDGCSVRSIPIKINSPDTGFASPCAVDAGDLSALAARLGIPANYSICSDFNEDGAADAADLSAIAAVLGVACEP